MRETRLSGSEGGAGSIPVPTPISSPAFRRPHFLIHPGREVGGEWRLPMAGGWL